MGSQDFHNVQTVFCKEKMEIIYYCHRRKKYYKNKIRVDLNLEIQRKINGLKFDLIYSESKLSNPTLIIKTVDGQYSIIGDPCSIPAYLFGPEYWFAKRVNPNDNFDFRKEAFVPISGAAARYRAKYQKSEV